MCSSDLHTPTPNQNPQHPQPPSPNPQQQQPPTPQHTRSYGTPVSHNISFRDEALETGHTQAIDWTHRQRATSSESGESGAAVSSTTLQQHHHLHQTRHQMSIPTSLELWASSKIIGRECALVNKDFFICKKSQGPEPQKCDAQSASVTNCATKMYVA